MTPLKCWKCGKFIGKDGYPDIAWDDYHGGFEEGYSFCGPCGRKEGRKDLRDNEPMAGREDSERSAKRVVETVGGR